MIEQRLCIVVEDVKEFTKSRRNQFEIKPESIAAGCQMNLLKFERTVKNKNVTRWNEKMITLDIMV